MLASARTLRLPTIWCPSISGFKSQGSGLVLKDIRQGCGRSVMCNAMSFGVRCSVFGAKHPDGVWSIGSGNKSSRLCTQSQFTRCLTSRMEGPYILELYYSVVGYGD